MLRLAWKRWTTRSIPGWITSNPTALQPRCECIDRSQIEWVDPSSESPLIHSMCFPAGEGVLRLEMLSTGISKMPNGS